MALNDQIPLGMCLPHRSPDPIEVSVIQHVAQRADVARAEVHRWFSEVYHNPGLTEAGGVFGTPEQVREQLEALVDAGANHLLLNPITRFSEQTEALAEIVGLS